MIASSSGSCSFANAYVGITMVAREVELRWGKKKGENLGFWRMGESLGFCKCLCGDYDGCKWGEREEEGRKLGVFGRRKKPWGFGNAYVGITMVAEIRWEGRRSRENAWVCGKSEKVWIFASTPDVSFLECGEMEKESWNRESNWWIGQCCLREVHRSFVLMRVRRKFRISNIGIIFEDFMFVMSWRYYWPVGSSNFEGWKFKVWREFFSVKLSDFCWLEKVKLSIEFCRKQCDGAWLAISE